MPVTESAFAGGVASRLGVGKVQHLGVRLLSPQEAVRERELSIVKIKGDTNRADIITKPLNPARHAALLNLSPLEKPRSRSGTASHISAGALAGLLVAGLLVVAERYCVVVQTTTAYAAGTEQPFWVSLAVFSK